MSNNKYIVKSLTPWMMDELIAFSLKSDFDLILLRKPDEFYKEGLEKLRSNKINIYIRPLSFKSFFRKVLLSLKFFFVNINKFGIGYNAVIGFKSILWFMTLDLGIFSESSKIHAQFATQPALISLMIKRYFKNKPQISFTFHAYDIYYNNSWLKLLVKSSHKVFSISNFNIEYVKNNYLSSKNIVLARLGVFRKKNENFHKPISDTFRLGLLSWFVEKKGIDYLLETFEKLKLNGFKNIKLVLAGDGPLKNKYLKIIKENDLSNQITYLGRLNNTDKEEFYKSISLFVLPSIKLKNDQDGIPVVLMEALAYKLPIISTNISGIPEICIDNFNGRLIEERDVDGLYNSILELYENEDKRKLYASNSYSLSKEYDIELNSEKKLKQLDWI